VSPIIVLIGVGVMAVSAAVTLAVLIIGIKRSDQRHLANAPRSHSEEFARRLLLGVRYPESPEPPAESARIESRWPGK
jgi:predicted RND superfamily exporter protein